MLQRKKCDKQTKMALKKREKSLFLINCNQEQEANLKFENDYTAGKRERERNWSLETTLSLRLGWAAFSGEKLICSSVFSS